MGLLLRGGRGRGGDGGREGEGVGAEREGMSVFSLSRPVNPKHMHLSDYAQMLSCNGYEPIASQITFAISTCLLDNSAER